MPTLVADEYEDIARRMREIAGEKTGRSGNGNFYGIWFAHLEGRAGWCRISAGGKWAIYRDGDEAPPSLYIDPDEAARVIRDKDGGSWDPREMSVIPYDPHKS